MILMVRLIAIVIDHDEERGDQTVGKKRGNSGEEGNNGGLDLNEGPQQES